MNMGSEGSPEPIDFDFFAEDDDDVNFGRNSSHRSSPASATASRKVRPGSATSASSARRDHQDTDRDSVHSASSRSSVSVKIPSAGPTGIRENAYSRRYSDSSDDDYTIKKTTENEFNKSGFKKQTNLIANNNKSKDRKSMENGDSSKRTSSSSRPKTSKGSRGHRRHDSSSSQGSDASKSHNSSFSSQHSDSYTSISESDSDVTDVSPLASPARSMTPRLEYDQDEFEDSFEESRSREATDPLRSGGDSGSRHGRNNKKARKKESVRFAGVAPNSSVSQRDKRLDETEARELSKLLRAVLELDETPNRSQLNTTYPQGKRYRSASARNAVPVAALPAGSMPHQRVNLSFSNDKVRQIDRENQRLLQKILNRPKSGPSISGVPPVARKQEDSQPRKMTSHSAIGRQRQQRKIEMENRKILERIEATRACSAIQRTTLLQEHNKQMQYASQVSKTSIRVRPISSRSEGYAQSGSLGKGSSVASLTSDISHTSNSSHGSRRMRPSSGRSMPPPPRGPKQAWDERW